MRPKLPAWMVLGSGLGAFVLAFLVSRVAVPSLLLEKYPWAPQVVLKVLLVVFSLLLMWVAKIPARVLGLFRSFNPRSTSVYILIGILLGITATALMIFFRLPGHPLVMQLSFTQLVLVIWVLSTLGEEVFLRVYVQPALETAMGTTHAPVMFTALLFGAMHAGIYFSGGAISTTLLLMGFTFLLGITAGYARHKGNLASAILVHLGFNVAGYCTGLIYVNCLAW